MYYTVYMYVQNEIICYTIDTHIEVRYQ